MSYSRLFRRNRERTFVFCFEFRNFNFYEPFMKIILRHTPRDHQNKQYAQDQEQFHDRLRNIALGMIILKIVERASAELVITLDSRPEK